MTCVFTERIEPLKKKAKRFFKKGSREEIMEEIRDLY
jgi:hypothetical protein